MLLFTHTIYTRRYLRNNYIMVLICKQSEFMLCQVCPQDDKQTTFKMLVFLSAELIWLNTEV